MQNLDRLFKICLNALNLTQTSQHYNKFLNNSNLLS